MERLARGLVGPEDLTEARLYEHLKNRRISPELLVTALADQRGEQVPQEGYLFVHPHWTQANSSDGSRHLSELTEAAKVVATSLRMDDLVSASHQLKWAGMTSAQPKRMLQESLASTVSAVGKTLRKSSFHRRVSRVAEARWRLDSARRSYLASILPDEVMVDEPVEAPTPDAAKHSPKGLEDWRNGTLNALEGIYASDDFVTISRQDFRLLKKLNWAIDLESDIDWTQSWPEEVPDWYLGLPYQSGEVHVRNFGWNREELRWLQEQRDQRTRNDGLWARWKWENLNLDLSSFERAEALLRLINDYRFLLGRSSLSWNSQLQLAAQQHVEYLSAGNEFGHLQDHPKSATPQIRARLHGYPHPVAENILFIKSFNRALGWWIDSKQHHRNIINKEATHAGLAISGQHYIVLLVGGPELE